MIAIRWIGKEPKPPVRPAQPAISTGFPYQLWWNRHGRRHKNCRVLARGSKNSVLLEFEDGFTMVTSRHAMRVSRKP